MVLQNHILMVVNNNEFKRQTGAFIKEYPNFHVRTDSGLTYLKGILDIPDDEGGIAGSFSIEIHPSKDFPFAFPVLYEVGDEIPCEADWHKYSDNSCCLTVPAKEKLLCKQGITLLWFVTNIVIPYFANQLYKKRTGQYMQEYSHGSDGVREFYDELFHSRNLGVWMRCLENAFGRAKSERNETCYCNSGKKYKRCHLLIEDDVRKIGKEQIMIDFKIMNLI